MKIDAPEHSMPLIKKWIVIVAFVIVGFAAAVLDWLTERLCTNNTDKEKNNEKEL